MESSSRAIVFEWEDYYYNTLFTVDDRISEKARQVNYTMSQFERLRDYELWRFFQGFDDDTTVRDLCYD